MDLPVLIKTDRGVLCFWSNGCISYRDTPRPA